MSLGNAAFEERGSRLGENDFQDPYLRNQLVQALDFGEETLNYNEHDMSQSKHDRDVYKQMLNNHLRSGPNLKLEVISSASL